MNDTIESGMDFLSVNLQHYIDAQRLVRDNVTSELRRGKKETHWMWYVFPQIRGLSYGYNFMSQRYDIVSPDQARAYLSHPDLGPQLREWTELVFQHDNLTATDIFGTVDAMKFQSSMTLFYAIDEPRNNLFGRTLDKFYEGVLCQKTAEWINLYVCIESQ